MYFRRTKVSRENCFFKRKESPFAPGGAEGGFEKMPAKERMEDILQEGWGKNNRYFLAFV
jgi:hypothetical protein